MRSYPNRTEMPQPKPGKRACTIALQAVIITVMSLNSAMGASQDKKRAEAVRSSGTIQIDGKLDEESWKQAVPAGDFVIYNPHNGMPSAYRTEVRLLYVNIFCL